MGRSPAYGAENRARARLARLIANRIGLTIDRMMEKETFVGVASVIKTLLLCKSTEGSLHLRTVSEGKTSSLHVSMSSNSSRICATATSDVDAAGGSLLEKVYEALRVLGDGVSLSRSETEKKLRINLSEDDLAMYALSHFSVGSTQN